jgi:ferric iron reductase protein FhuF
MGMREPLVAVHPDDPLAGRPGTVVVADLPRYFREILLDGHLSPILEHLHGLVRVGRRTLLGSVASGVAYALVRAGDALPGELAGTAGTLLDALGVADLVDVTEGPAVQRRTCCLAFTLPEPKVCQGCCINTVNSSC